MRGTAAILGSALLALLLWWLLLSEREVVPAPQDLEPTPTAAAAPLPADGSVDRRDSAAEPAPPAAMPTPEARPPAAAANAGSGDSMRIVVRALDEVSQQPLAKFSLVLSGPTGRQVLSATDGTIEFTTQHNQLIEMLVEADGYEPHQASFAQAATTIESLPLTVNLRRAAGPAAGITLHVRDTTQEVVGNVVVQVFRQPAEAGDGSWRLSPPMWSRHARRADGIYTLPSLGAGSFLVRVLAADALGTVQPTLPYEGTFELTGSNGFVEHVTLEAGCVPEFECVDRYGQPLPAPEPATRVILRSPGGPDVARGWLARSDDRLVRAIDQLPATGIVWPEVPVAAGTWEVLLTRDDRAPHRELVTLPAGERPRLRLATPW